MRLFNFCRYKSTKQSMQSGVRLLWVQREVRNDTIPATEHQRMYWETRQEEVFFKLVLTNETKCIVNLVNRRPIRAEPCQAKFHPYRQNLDYSLRLVVYLLSEFSGFVCKCSLSCLILRSWRDEGSGEQVLTLSLTRLGNGIPSCSCYLIMKSRSSGSERGEIVKKMRKL